MKDNLGCIGDLTIRGIKRWVFFFFTIKGFFFDLLLSFFLCINVIRVKIGVEDELQKTKAVSHVISYACYFLYFVSMQGFAFLSPS